MDAPPTGYVETPVPAPVSGSLYPGVALTPTKWPVSVAFSVAALMTLSTIGVAILTSHVPSLALERSDGDVALRLALLAGPYALVGALILVCAARMPGGVAANVGLRRFVLLPGALVIVGGSIAARLAVTQLTVLLLSFGLTPPDVDITRLFPDTAFGVAALVFVTVIVGPFGEELVFRGVMLPALRDRWGTAVAVLVSSAIFGAVHGSAFLFLPMMAAGAIMAVCYLSTRSLWVAFGMHAVFNLTAVGLQYALRAAGLL